MSSGKTLLRLEEPGLIGLLVGLLRHARFATALDARHRLSLTRQFYPRGSGVPSRQSGVRLAQIGRRTSVDSCASWRRPRDTRNAVAQHQGKTHRPHLDQATEHYPQHAKVSAISRRQAGKRLSTRSRSQGESVTRRRRSIFTTATSVCRQCGPRASISLAMNGKRRLVVSFWHGSMAHAMRRRSARRHAFPAASDLRCPARWF